MTEFWNSEITEASWSRLQELSKEMNFVLIGGWAVYIYTKMQKSKDIDIIIDYETLRYLESKYRLDKNERLKKYEIKQDKFDIDVYLPNYSELTVPPNDIIHDFSRKVSGFNVPIPEILLILKLGAAENRFASIKGTKDSIDILNLLLYSSINLKLLKKMLTRYELIRLLPFLLSILQNFNKKDFDFVNLNEKSFAVLKKKYLKEIKSIV